MRAASVLRPLLLAATLGSSLALAGPPVREVKEFQPPRKLTAEEIAREKELSKSNLNGYNRDITAEVTPVPWMAIGLFTVIFLVAAPFMIRAFRNTSMEIGTSSRAINAGQPRRRPAPGADPE